jgi:hypothetical protein
VGRGVTGHGSSKTYFTPIPEQFIAAVLNLLRDSNNSLIARRCEIQKKSPQRRSVRTETPRQLQRRVGIWWT